MGGCTVRVSNIPLTAVAKELVSFVERIIGKDCVYACEIKTERMNWKSRGFGRVQFENGDAAVEACKLSQSGLLLFQKASLVVCSIHNDIIPRPMCRENSVPGGRLHVGCPVYHDAFYVLWSSTNVVAEFVPEREKLNFFLSEGGMEYKLEVFFQDIIQTHACTLQGRRTKAILLQLQSAPRIYHKMALHKLSSMFGEDRYNFCKEDSAIQWIRTTDFSAFCSIGQSTSFCLELPYGVEVAQITEILPYYRSMEEELTLENGISISSSLSMVPIINAPEGVNLPYEIMFQVNSLVHRGILSLPTLCPEFFDLLRHDRTPLVHINLALTELHKLKATCFEPEKWLENQFNKLQNKQTQLKSATVSRDHGLMNFHRVLVTPAKVYFLGPELNVSNCVTRQYAKYIDDFLRVSFVDEDWNKLHSTALSVKTEYGLLAKPLRTEIYRRILSVLKEGIVIGNKRFEFLAFSASQLRENSVWMFASNDKVSVDSIRKWMGEFCNMRNIAKCASRMGQCFSSSKQTISVPEHEVLVIPDIEISSDGIRYCFSDGIGKISLQLAKQMASKCGLRMPPPSAFQIRYGGYKGVVAVDPTSFIKLSLRPSMLKFNSKNTMLDVINWSRFLPCFLNREIITLLSTLGVPDQNFEYLQKKTIEHLDHMLVSTERALDVLQIMCLGEDHRMLVEMLLGGYSPNTEPYLSMMLQAFREYQLSDLRTKCRIFVSKGRVLMGCLDETEVLNYGEVFVQVSRINTKFCYDGLASFGYDKWGKSNCIVQGKVVVAKNPCLHPGDIRLLHAVDVPGLHHMVDCLVFPQKGERPHPNECSGSDLDGDLYFVSWDELLIPPDQDQPMDYVGRQPIQLDHEVTIEEIQEYFVNYMLNDSLGVIANTHVVYADREPSKARSPTCQRLAMLHSKAVDFPKTGAPAEMPLLLFPKEYPDFMEKWDKPMYMSTGILGKLYRAVKDNSKENNFISIFTGEDVQNAYDNDLKVEGLHNFVQDALMHKSWYDTKLAALMEYYGVKSEAEIVSGNINRFSKFFEKDKKKYGDIKEKIMVAVRSLRKEARGWFEDSCKVHHNHSAMASAWYHVTYHPDYWTKVHFISFPWVIYDILLNIKSLNQRKEKSY
uniref:RNA-dependent RNA polymerase n=1 Tax=Cycas revoluta TaxID=3396 RepID=A0A0C4W3E0_CYCRE|nr:RNA-dependent RNA polymerase 2 [Cycas revoluta]